MGLILSLWVLLCLWLSLNLPGCSSTICLGASHPQLSHPYPSLLNTSVPCSWTLDSFLKGASFWLLGRHFKLPKPAPSFPFPLILPPSPPFCSFLLKVQLPKQETPFILSLFYVTLHLSPRQLVVPLNPPSHCHPQSQPAHCVSPVPSHPEPPKLVSLTQLLPLQPILEFYVYSTIWSHLSHVSKPPVVS